MSDTRWMWIEVGCTVAIPTAVLMFGTDWLGAAGALGVGLLFPVGFAAASMLREGQPSRLSVVALLSVALTGGIGLLELDPRWFAIKEAALPGILGLLMAASAPTRYAVVPLILERVLDPARIRAALLRSGGEASFEGATRRATVEMGLVTAASGLGSFALASLLVRSAAGTEDFARELGRYTLWSFLAVSLPVLLATARVLQRALRALEEAVDRPLEELMLGERTPSEPPDQAV